jgi:hypothetical protein
MLPDSSKHDLALQLRACQSASRRNGKVARLPEALRQQINQMIDDGLPYKAIIQKLGGAGKHLNEDNLSNWRLGGYQDHLKAQVLQDRARTQTEAAADLLRDGGDVDLAKLRQICTQIGLLQYLDTLRTHGEQLAREALQKNPAKLITLMNACSHASNANIAIEKSKQRNADFKAAVSPAPNRQHSNSSSPNGDTETDPA